MRDSGRGLGEKRADVVYQVSGTCRLLDDPPNQERNGRPSKDRLQAHFASLEAPTLLRFPPVFLILA